MRGRHGDEVCSRQRLRWQVPTPWGAPQLPEVFKPLHQRRCERQARPGLCQRLPLRFGDLLHRTDAAGQQLSMVAKGIRPRGGCAQTNRMRPMPSALSRSPQHCWAPSLPQPEHPFAAQGRRAAGLCFGSCSAVDAPTRATAERDLPGRGSPATSRPLKRSSGGRAPGSRSGPANADQGSRSTGRSLGVIRDAGLAGWATTSKWWIKRLRARLLRTSHDTLKDSTAEACKSASDPSV